MKKQEETENFIQIWREQPSLWDVKSPIYKDRNEKVKSFQFLRRNWEWKVEPGSHL